LSGENLAKQAALVFHQASMTTLNRMPPEGAQPAKQDDPEMLKKTMFVCPYSEHLSLILLFDWAGAYP